ncbi:MAG: hypothetical protein FJ004_08495 [Chloroflexi bacterium]|nr:hypothetical protein [Chloroflexota bacterium]
MRKIVFMAVCVLAMALVFAAIGCGGGTSTSDVGTASPKAGATFTGPIEITGKAESGTITLTISEDGASVASVSVVLNNLKCDGFSAGSMNKSVSTPFPVTNGSFATSLSGIGDIAGSFTTMTKASGTVDLVLQIPFSSATCELGEWHWSAEAE